MPSRNRLDPALWAEIRRRWEYDVNSPSFADAAGRAAGAHCFVAPSKSAIHARAHREGWERRGSMTGIAAAAHQKADALANADGAKKEAIESVRAAQASRVEAESLRAEVLARHRGEWHVIGTLMSEAIERRHTDVVDAFTRAKVAKISAESLALKQAGERKAWNLDGPEVGDLSRLSDSELEQLARGKLPR